MAWRQLSLRTRHPEFAEEILDANGAVSVSVLPTDDAEAILEPGPGQTPMWQEALVQGLFADDADLDPARAALAELLPDGDGVTPDEALVPDADWVRNCLDSMTAMRFGERLWVTPHHRDAPDDDAVVVKLDPGLAFGTGTHPTTDLCLRWLDGAALAGKRVLDYGSGSGILAVAALKLGAREAVAVDNDPQAVRASRENAINNGVADALHCCDIDAFNAGTGFDVVLANILAEPLIVLAPTLLSALRPNGDIVLAGLLDRQADRVAAAYPGIDWTREGHEGWTRLAGRSTN